MEVVKGSCFFCDNNIKVLKHVDAVPYLQLLPSMLGSDINISEFEKCSGHINLCPLCCYNITESHRTREKINACQNKEFEIETGQVCILCNITTNLMVMNNHWKYFTERLKMVPDIPTQEYYNICFRCFQYIDFVFKMKSLLYRKYPKVKFTKKVVASPKSISSKSDDSPRKGCLKAYDINTPTNLLPKGLQNTLNKVLKHLKVLEKHDRYKHDVNVRNNIQILKQVPYVFLNRDELMPQRSPNKNGKRVSFNLKDDIIDSGCNKENSKTKKIKPSRRQSIATNESEEEEENTETSLLENSEGTESINLILCESEEGSNKLKIKFNSKKTHEEEPNEVDTNKSERVSFNSTDVSNGNNNKLSENGVLSENNFNLCDDEKQLEISPVKRKLSSSSNEGERKKKRHKHNKDANEQEDSLITYKSPLSFKIKLHKPKPKSRVKKTYLKSAESDITELDIEKELKKYNFTKNLVVNLIKLNMEKYLKEVQLKLSDSQESELDSKVNEIVDLGQQTDSVRGDSLGADDPLMKKEINKLFVKYTGLKDTVFSDVSFSDNGEDTSGLNKDRPTTITEEADNQMSSGDCEEKTEENASPDKQTTEENHSNKEIQLTEGNRSNKESQLTEENHSNRELQPVEENKEQPTEENHCEVEKQPVEENHSNKEKEEQPAEVNHNNKTSSENECCSESILLEASSTASSLVGTENNKELPIINLKEAIAENCTNLTGFETNTENVLGPVENCLKDVLLNLSETESVSLNNKESHNIINKTLEGIDLKLLNGSESCTGTIGGDNETENGHNERVDNEFLNN